MNRRAYLHERYHRLLDRYSQARIGRRLRQESIAAIERELAKVGAAMSASQANLGDGRSRRLLTLQNRFRTILTLYASAVCMRKIREEFISAINSQFVAIALTLGLTFQTLYDEALQQCQSQQPEQSVSVVPTESETEEPLELDVTRPTQRAVIPSTGLPLPLPMSLEDYTRSVRTRLISLNLEGFENRYATLIRQIDELSEKPESFDGTKKAWQERNQEELDRLREGRNMMGKTITRFRNEDFSDKDEKLLDDQAKSRWERTKGQLTEEQRDERLAEIMPFIFEEDKSEQFFPTPPAIVQDYLIARADLQPGMSVLEPSAGKGNIADGVRKACPTCSIQVIEKNDRRAEVLQLKGYELVGRDALKYTGAQYDRILMNPPYDGAVGINHVIHAFTKLLKPGGRLLALLNRGAYTNTSNLDTVKLRKNYIDKYGQAEVIPIERYREGIERGITIDIAFIQLDKPLVETRDVAVPLNVSEGIRVVNRATQAIWKVTKIDPETGDITIQSRRDDSEKTLPVLPSSRWAIHEEAEWIKLPERSDTAVDTSFRKPSIITARAELTGTARGFYVDRSILSKDIKDYAIEGANYAIEALQDRGGFLLTDGTGTGKTVQQLLVAHYWYMKTGKPVLIFTESDQIIQQSFFGDAKKLLGLNTPDMMDDKQRPAKRPRDYQGLYDADTDTYYDEAPTLEDGAVNVVRFRSSQGIVDGINIGTYNDISNLRSLDNHPAERDVVLARKTAKTARSEYAARREAIYDSLKGDSKKEALAELAEEQQNDPRFPAVIVAEDAWVEAQGEILQPWVEGISCLIYDEAHNLKNTGLGGSNRAQRAEFLSEAAPRAMFVTATPADKPGDVLYLKRAGLYKDETQFRYFMRSIGFYWQKPKFNKRGEVIRRGEWKPDSKHPIEASIGGLASIFDRLTEERQMLKREIELTNLDSPTMIDVPIDPSVQKHMHVIEEAIIDKAKRKAAKSDSEGSVPITEILMEQKRELEKYKIDKCIELTRQELLEGRSVVVFADLVEEGEEEKAWGDKKAGTIRVLKERLEEIMDPRLIGYVTGVAGQYEKQERLKGIQAFQRGEKRVMIGTIGSGGTGISLDDTKGNAPRTLIIMTAPMNSIKTVQVIGRVVRANTKSRSRAFFLFADIDIDSWLKNLLATKLTMLGAMVAGQVTLLNPKKVEELESGGDEGVAAEFRGSSDDGDRKKKPHSLFNKKDNIWIEGKDYPQELPLSVGHFRDEHVYGRNFVRIKADSPRELMRFAEEQQETFTKFGFVRRSVKYKGPFYECPYSDEAWIWALNVIKLEQANIVSEPRQLFGVGEIVVALEDITVSGTKAGTQGKITNVRPRTRYYLYDVAFDDGTVGLSIEQYMLGSTRPLHNFSVGQVYSKIDVQWDQYHQKRMPHRLRVTIDRVHGTDEHSLFDVSVHHEVEIHEGEWTYSQYRPEPDIKTDITLDALEEAISSNELTCEVNCTPASTGESYAAALPGEAGTGLGDDSASAEKVDPDRGVSPSTSTYAKDKPPVVRNIKEIAGLRIKRRPLSSRFQALFGSVPEKRCRYFIHGPAGHGKSALAWQYCDEIARQEELKGKRVLYVNAEQPSDGGGMTDRIRNNNVKAAGIDIVDTGDMNVIRELLRSGTYSFVVIDSISRVWGTPTEQVKFLLSLYEEFPSISFMVIAHEDKVQKTYKGPSDLAHDSEVWVRVEKGYATAEKSHFDYGSSGEPPKVKIFDYNKLK